MSRQALLESYRKRRKEVVRLRDEELLTFDEIAKIIGVTRARIIQIYQFEKSSDAEN